MGRLGLSKLDLHAGSAILRAANVYPTLLEVILEMVQNSSDKGALKIWITLNQKSRSLAVKDNGDGVDQSEFDEALLQVGKTIKKSDKLSLHSSSSPLEKNLMLFENIF